MLAGRPGGSSWTSLTRTGATDSILGHGGGRQEGGRKWICIFPAGGGRPASGKRTTTAPNYLYQFASSSRSAASVIGSSSSGDVGRDRTLLGRSMLVMVITAEALVAPAVIRAGDGKVRKTAGAD